MAELTDDEAAAMRELLAERAALRAAAAAAIDDASEAVEEAADDAKDADTVRQAEAALDDAFDASTEAREAAELAARAGDPELIAAAEDVQEDASRAVDRAFDAVADELEEAAPAEQNARAPESESDMTATVVDTPVAAVGIVTADDAPATVHPWFRPLFRRS